MFAYNLPRRLTAEFIGTAGLLLAIVGSGIMAERLSGGNEALTLLANSLATGAALLVLIVGLMNISGAHFNPAVSLTEAYRGNLGLMECFAYVGAQISGAFAGVAASNVIFGLSAFAVATKSRAGSELFLSEVIATFGLIAVIQATVKFRVEQVGLMVGAYITGAYWFTSSTSFANPAVTLARAATDTFTGIAPGSVPGFLAAEIVGAFLATFLFAWLLKQELPNENS